MLFKMIMNFNYFSKSKDTTHCSVDCVYDKMAISWFPATPALNLIQDLSIDHSTKPRVLRIFRP